MIKPTHFACLFLFCWSFSLNAQQALDLNKVSITVSKMDEAVGFYTHVLSFEKVNGYELSGKNIQRLFGIYDENLRIEVAQLQLGNEMIELMEFHTADTGRIIPQDSRSNDLWFQHIAIVVSDMPKAYQILVKNKIKHVSTSPQKLPDYIPAAAGVEAFYFRDPDDHNLELIYFPQDKGNPRWKNPTDALFLGIDHTAIGIEQTEKTLLFYRDFLGLKIAGSSENYGTEQEHLNQVFGARLLITGLQAKEGFGLEFLEYIAPPGGRIYPLDSRTNDLWHWHTTIKMVDLEALYQKALETNHQIISTGLVDLSGSPLNANKGFLMRGPDGHVILLIE